MPRVRPRPPSAVAAPARFGRAWFRASSDRLPALAAAGVVAYLGLSSAWFVQIFVTDRAEAPRHAVADVVGLALCLPVLVALVLRASSGRARGSGWLLALLALVVGGLLPLGGVLWLFVAQFLAGAILVVLPTRWALPAFASVALSVLLVAHAEREGLWGPYMCVKTLEGGVALAVLVALVRALRQVHAARAELADQAVVAERVRIDDVVTHEISGALHGIVALGERASTGGDGVDVAAVLESLVSYSRETLARTRRLLASYQEVSAATELRTAVTLLAGAGISARVERPTPGAAAHSAPLSAQLRAELRAGVGRVLADERVSACVIALSEDESGGACLSITAHRAPRVGVR